MSLKLAWFFWFTVWGLASSASGQAPSPVGAVHFRILDSYGNPLSPNEIKLVSTTGSAIPGTASAAVVRNVPFGEYKVRIHVPGFSYWDSLIIVDRLNIEVTVVMPIASMEGLPPSCSVFGTVEGVSPNSILRARVRLLPVFADKSFESELSATGHFRVSTAVCGYYILTLLIDRDVVWTRPLVLSLETGPISIKLNQAGAGAKVKP